MQLREGAQSLAIPFTPLSWEPSQSSIQYVPGTVLRFMYLVSFKFPTNAIEYLSSSSPFRDREMEAGEIQELASDLNLDLSDSKVYILSH